MAKNLGLTPSNAVDCFWSGGDGAAGYHWHFPVKLEQ